jgi:hypothetical protein
LREGGAAVLHETVQGLAHEEGGDAEPRLLAQVALRPVPQDRGLAWCQLELGIEEPPQGDLALFRREGPARIDH